MKKTLITFISFLLLTDLFSQQGFATTDSNYVKGVGQAFEHLKAGECQPCLEKYETAFLISQRSILSRLRAAVCAFNCKNEAKWQFHLNFAIDKDWSQSESILKDFNNQYPEITQLKETELYTTALKQIKAIKIKSGFDEALAAELETIFKDDQALRQSLRDLKTEEEKRAVWEKITVLDSLNLIKIEKIFAQHGYPGKSKVGPGLASAAFLVIQHSELSIQEKYFPLIEKAANEGELDKQSFALLVDRIRMYKGQPQLYGSQLQDKDGDGKMEFHTIEDEENVNKRRAEMGMGPIEEYAKFFGIEYKYIKKN